MLCPSECCVTWLGKGGGQGERKFGYGLHEVGAKVINNNTPPPPEKKVKKERKRKGINKSGYGN